MKDTEDGGHSKKNGQKNGQNIRFHKNRVFLKKNLACYATFPHGHEGLQPASYRQLIGNLRKTIGGTPQVFSPYRHNWLSTADLVHKIDTENGQKTDTQKAAYFRAAFTILDTITIFSSCSSCFLRPRCW